MTATTTTKFKAGDKVRRIANSFCECIKGGIYTVYSILPAGALTLNGVYGSFMADKFERVEVSQKPKTDAEQAIENYFHAIATRVPVDAPVSFLTGDHTIVPSLGKKFDSGKPDFTLLPFKGLEDVVAVLGFGAVKYGRENWRQVQQERYVAAAFRHLVEIVKGNEFDEETGKPHAAHLACCALFLSDLSKPR